MVHGLEPLAGIKRSGIYALSVPCMKDPKIIKIGKAKDLGSRIDQYQLYFPFSVSVELLWIFPKGVRNVDLKLQKVERFIHALLEPVHTTARRRRTEWFWDSKKKIADAFLQAANVFRGGLLVNPAYTFTLTDLSKEEMKRNLKAKIKIASIAKSQLTIMRKNFPRDYDFLCSCKNWKTDPGQYVRCQT